MSEKNKQEVYEVTVTETLERVVCEGRFNRRCQGTCKNPVQKRRKSK